MRKFLGLILIVAGMGLAMPAQAQFRFGVKGGLNLAKASFSKGDFNKDNFTGFFIGPMAELTIPIVGLGVDGALLFSQRGVKVEGESLKQNGIEIPLNLKYNIGLGSLLGVYFAAGPDFYYNFKGDETINNVKIDRQTMVTSLNLGAGVKLIKHLQIGANYNLPLSKTGDLGDFDYKTKMWQVSVAYMF
ncbi:MAG: porin family protein [Bacteroidia bacterium]|nr:porin family protein [Bacteroidia bacterium]